MKVEINKGCISWVLNSVGSRGKIRNIVKNKIS